MESREEFFVEIRSLVDRWCERRELAPLAYLLPAYVSFNGMTDGWGELRNALRNVRCLRNQLPDEELIKVHVVQTTEKALER